MSGGVTKGARCLLLIAQDLPLLLGVTPRVCTNRCKDLKRIPKVLPSLARPRAGLDMLGECSVASLKNNVSSLRLPPGVPRKWGWGMG